MKKVFDILLVLLITCVGILFGNDNVGRTAGTFLKIPIGSRKIGMAEAFTAVADDPYALTGNVAGIARNRDLEISFSHTEWFQDVNYEFLAFSKSFFKGFLGLDSTMGVALNYLHLPVFNSYNDWGEVIEQVGFSDYALTLGYAQNLGFLNAGIGIRYINEVAEGQGDGALTFNLGLLYALHLPAFQILNHKFLARVLDIGFLVENWDMGTSIANYSTPVSYKLGLATRLFDNFLTALDVQIPLDNTIRVNTGLEYSINKMFFFRFGYRFFGYDVDSYTMGIGGHFALAGKIIKLDAAFAPASGLGNTFNFSLSMNYPGKISDGSRKDAQILYYKGIYFFTSGEYDKAIALWKEALKLDPKFKKAIDKIKEAENLKEMKKIEGE